MPERLAPVIVLAPPRYVAGLGVMRTLRPLGVPVFSLAHHRASVATSSRYCAGTIVAGFDGRPLGHPGQVLADLLRAGRRLGQGTILVPCSDEWAAFVATWQAELGQVFRFPRLPAALVGELASKDGLQRLALQHGLSTPRLAVARHLADAVAFAAASGYPVVLKPVVSEPDQTRKALAHTVEELRQQFASLATAASPGVAIQEYVPGGDSDVWMFNGYFDDQSRCLAGFTGHKLREHPAHMGIASLAVCRANSIVMEVACRFLAAVGYRGLVDIDFRFDSRDGRYKVLDVNPRLGGAFRAFVDRDGLDIVRALYLDITGRSVPAVRPREGRRWIKEDADLIARKYYRRTDGLTLLDWLRSLRGVQEGATFSLRDPLPFVLSMYRLVEETMLGRWRRLRLRRWADVLLWPASPTGKTR